MSFFSDLQIFLLILYTLGQIRPSDKFWAILDPYFQAPNKTSLIANWIKFENFNQKRDVESVKNQLEKLPSQIDLGIHYRDVLIDHKLLSQVLQTEITRIVKQSSVAQTKTNFFTSGPVRSVNYGFAKVKKYLRSVQ